MKEIFRIEEPVLFFRNNNKCLDPQVGLLKYGPFGGRGTDSDESVTIRAGIIGTTRSIEATKTWLNRLKYRIIAVERQNTEYKGIDFPGLSKEGPLKFDIIIDPNCVLKINRKFVVDLNKKERKERVYNAALEYCNKIDDLSEAHPAPDIILIPIDDDILRYCKEPGRITDKIVYQHREFGDTDALNAPMFDFHNYIKAHSALSGFVTQLLLPKTIKFAEERQSPSIIGWNIAVAIYYKATGVPWKLADIDDKTCYVGVSFYNEIKTSRKIIRPSFAQVYMRTGESQVIRGQPFQWDFDEMGRLINLNSSQMENLISKSLEVYYNQRNELPRRLVIHKSTHFSDEELSGCESASEDIDELDIVHISDYTRFRAYHENYDYPVVRGTVIANSNEAIIFTTGYVPALATYPGPSVPRPIHIKCQRIDTSLDTICKDIMSLTKLDWNSSTFYTKMPVTLSVSKKVGAVMAEMDTESVEPPSSYRFYM